METELGSSDQEVSSSAVKNTGEVLVLCSRMEVRPTAITDISEVPGCHLLQQMSSQ